MHNRHNPSSLNDDRTKIENPNKITAIISTIILNLENVDITYNLVRLITYLTKSLPS